MKIKKGNTVIVLAGADKGKIGLVTRVLPKESKILVEGVNVKKVYERAKKKDGKGQMIEKAFPIHASNVRKEVESKK